MKTHDEVRGIKSSGYSWHLRRGETPCDGCQAAYGTWTRLEATRLRREAGVPVRAKLHEEVVGSLAGWHWHYRRHEPPCEECRLAFNAYHRARNALLRERREK